MKSPLFTTMLNEKGHEENHSNILEFEENNLQLLHNLHFLKITILLHLS